MISTTKQRYNDWIARAADRLRKKNARDRRKIGFREPPSPRYLLGRPKSFSDLLLLLWVCLVFLVPVSTCILHHVDVDIFVPQGPSSELFPVRELA